jgi:hypothetical protein
LADRLEAALTRIEAAMAAQASTAAATARRMAMLQAAAREAVTGLDDVIGDS